jgi:hypothetical protein
MSLAAQYQLSERFAACRRLGSFSLRSLARIVLASWLFTLAVCFFSDIRLNETPLYQAEHSTTSHGHDQPPHDGSTQHVDDCCTVLQNLSAFSKVSNIQIPLHNLVYVLLPYIVVVQAVLLVAAKVQFYGNDPPGKPKHALIANSVWPNAPSH